MKTLQQVALRQQALFVSQDIIRDGQKNMTPTTAIFLANLRKLGYGVSEQLLYALNYTAPAFHAQVLTQLREITGMNKNWTPLVKAWDNPTGETRLDHVITFFANLFKGHGTKLSCGHIIPDDTFPLERYNGCLFCGTPFVLDNTKYVGQGSKLKILELWTEVEASNFLTDLLTSKTALDATQMDSLKMLLDYFSVPDVAINMKETQMAVIDYYTAKNESEKAQTYFTSPTDILRYLWYKHTGFLQIIEPKTIVKRTAKNSRHMGMGMGKSGQAKLEAISSLHLKYGRKDAYMVAKWINALEMDVERICEAMHPKRGMWVRFIRALRLAEYSQKVGFEKLRAILDMFYNEDYVVWAGFVSYYRLRYDVDATMALLKQRPGLFARSLFANMLWFGYEPVIKAFTEVIDKVPARLVLTLGMYADDYFSTATQRNVKPLGGTNKVISHNALLDLYDASDLHNMVKAVQDLTYIAIEKRFAAVPNKNKTMYIEPVLYKIPLAIGDRGDNVQDLSAVLMGTRFAVEGEQVRLFMQWGTGLPAQHLDMDLSCRIAYDYRVDNCSYMNLVTTGCKHSGDIRSIPNQVGTAEYIELDLPALKKAGAKYVTFTSNAYSYGAISPNMVVGWMNSRYPMKISEKTGVAYDPSCVQHQVRVVNSLAKGLVFGVLDVKASEIVWLEMPFGGQIVQDLGANNIETLLRKLANKTTIGQLLEIKAKAQNLQLLNIAEAEEIYTRKWASNTAAVTQLLVA